MQPGDQGFHDSIALDVAHQARGVRVLIDKFAMEFAKDLESLAAESAEELRRVRANAAATLAGVYRNAAREGDASVVSGETR